MTLIPYFKIMREGKDPKYLRFEIVRYAQQHGVKPAARALGTTAKTVRQSGMQFIAFAGERALNYSTLFAEILIAHLQGCGVSLQDCRFQTDNGSEFIDAWNAAEDSAFTKAVEAVKGLVHQTIPPGAHTWQADVETVHGLIEDEFYCVERFHSRSHFLARAVEPVMCGSTSRARTVPKAIKPRGKLSRKVKRTFIRPGRLTTRFSRRNLAIKT